MSGCLPVAEAAAVVPHAVDPALAVLDRRRRGVHHHRVGNRRRYLEYILANDGCEMFFDAVHWFFGQALLAGLQPDFLFVHLCTGSSR